MSTAYTGLGRTMDTIPYVATSALRNARYPSPPTNFRVQNGETAAIEIWNGAVWIAEFVGVVPTGDFQYVHTQAGSTFYDKFLAAYNALPGTGGTIDASRMTGSQVSASLLTIAKPCDIILPWKADITANAGFLKITSDKVRVTGGGRRSCIIGGSLAWANSNLLGVEVVGVDGFTMRDVGILMQRTGSGIFAATNCMSVFIRDNDAHSTGSTNFDVSHCWLSANGTEPAADQRYLGLFMWTETSAPPILLNGGTVANNIVYDTYGRCIETALCKNVAITGNTIYAGGSAATVACVGVRVIGSEDIAVTGNVVEITGTSINNADCYQINGDNVSKSVTISGNTGRNKSNGGTGIKIGANASYATVADNTIEYNGTSNALYGILVTSNPGVTANPGYAAPTHIKVKGNTVWGFGTQLGIDREQSSDPYPNNVTFSGNSLGARWDGTSGIANAYNFNQVDFLANKIVCGPNDYLGVQQTLNAGNGGYWETGSNTELLTLNTGGTTTNTSANLLPVGSMIDAVTCRITTTIVTATNWSVGDSTTAARFSAANATLTAGTTSLGIDQWSGAVTTLAAGPSQAAAATVRITTTGTPSAGIIRITVYYRRWVAQTS